MKAATLPLSLFLFIGALTAGFAQTPQDDAVREAVMRQADRIALRQKLAEAGAAQARHDLLGAAKLYDEAWGLVLRIGINNIEPEAAQARSGLVAVRMELAQSATHADDYKEAKVHIDDILRVDPSNQQALEMRRINDRLLADQKGQIPSDEVRNRMPAIMSDKAGVSTKVHDGQLLFQMGRLDDAEKKLKEAVADDPQNSAAYYYLQLVAEARFKQAHAKRDVDSRSSLVAVEEAWATPVKRELLPVPNPYARTNLINTSKGRQAIYSKLDRIVLQSIGWDGLPLSEVIKTLSDEAKRRDPEKKGINFIISQNADNGGASAAPAAPGAVDPNTGLPIAAAPPAEQTDISQVLIRITPALSDVRLADVLDAIVKVADKPIKFSIEDYAVIFSLKGRDATPLYTRIIKVDPNTFEQGLESVTGFDFGAIAQASNSGGGGGGGGGIGGGGASSLGGGAGGTSGGGLLTVPRVVVAGSTTGGGGGTSGGQGQGLKAVSRTNDMVFVQAAVRQFFLTMGIDLNPPKSIFFNDREGSLVVYATLQDLDRIEQAVQVLNIAPPQVNIKAKFVEVGQNDTKALGFEWYLGNFLMNNQAVGVSGGTAPSFNGAPTPANPNGFFPGTSPANAIPSQASDQLITSGLRNTVNAPALGTITGILTDPQFRMVLHALDQRDGADLLNEASVTTLSGRQTQIQVVDLQTIVIGTSFNQTSSGGTGGTAGTVVNTGASAGVVATSLSYPTETLPFGPTLDLIPYVSADGFTVQMTIIPTLTEFIGYDPPGQFVPQAQSAAGSNLGLPIQAQLPLPHFRVRQVTTSAIVWDGQTVVLGGLITENVTKLKDKVPVLGDVPVVGRLFRSESSTTQKKHLMIFVTPTIIDPAGNRYHSEDEMPFAQYRIPEQRPQTPAAQ